MSNDLPYVPLSPYINVTEPTGGDPLKENLNQYYQVSMKCPSGVAAAAIVVIIALKAV